MLKSIPNAKLIAVSLGTLYMDCREGLPALRDRKFYSLMETCFCSSSTLANTSAAKDELWLACLRGGQLPLQGNLPSPHKHFTPAPSSAGSPLVSGLWPLGFKHKSDIYTHK